MLKDEISKLKDIDVVAEAIVQFAESLRPTNELQPDGNGRYVLRPDNFVTFKVHAARANNLTVTLRGNPAEFPTSDFPELNLKNDRDGYSSFKITKTDQLAAGTMFIRRANELYGKGRTREQRGQKIIDS